MANPAPAEVERKLIGEIATILSLDPDKVRSDQPLHTLGIDSMSFVEILVFIEKAFDLRLIESGLTREDFRTVQSLAACISREMAC